MSTTGFGDLLKAAAEAKFVVIPADTYAVVCRDANATKSSTGKPMIKGTWKVVVGPHKGSSLITQLTLTVDNPAAAAIFLRHVQAHGITEEELQALPPAEDGGPNVPALANMLKGRYAMASVSVGQWNDEDRNYIDNFKRPSADQMAAIEASVKESDPLASGVGSAAPAADPFAGGGSPAPSGLDAKPADSPF